MAATTCVSIAHAGDEAGTSWWQRRVSQPTFLGLGGAVEVIATSDQRYLLVATSEDANRGRESVPFFERDPETGLLDLLGRIELSDTDFPAGVAVAPNDGDVYIAEANNHRITHWERNQLFGHPSLDFVYRGEATTPAFGGPLQSPIALQVTPDGSQLWSVGLSDSRLQIHGLDPDGRPQSATAQDIGIVGARDLIFNQAGDRAYVSDWLGDQLIVLARTASGTQVVQRLENGVDGVQGLDGPYFLSWSPDQEDLYVSEFVGGGISHFSSNADGTLSWRGSYQGVTPLINPLGISVSSDGHRVVVTDLQSNSLHWFQRSSDGSLLAQQNLEGTGDLEFALGGPAGVTILGEHLYVAGLDYDSIAVFRQTPDDQFQLVEQQMERLQNFREYAWLLFPAADGDLIAWMEDESGGSHPKLARFRRDPETGGLHRLPQTQPLNPLAAANWRFSVDAAATADRRHAYVANAVDQFVGVDLSAGAALGQVHESTTGGAPGVPPMSVVLSSDENWVYVAGNNGQVTRFARDTVTGQTTLAGSDFVGQGLQWLALAPDQAFAYAAKSAGTGSIVTLQRDGTTGALTPIADTIQGIGGVDGLQQPVHLAISPDGQWLVAATLRCTDPGCHQNQLSVFRRDPLSGQLTFTSHLQLTFDLEPQRIGFGPSGARLWLRPRSSSARAVDFELDRTTGTLTSLDRNGARLGPSLDMGSGWHYTLRPTVGIYGLFAEDLFVADFESGDLSRWSASSR